MSKLNANRKGNRLLRLMIFASFFAALIFIATAFLPRIPTALGYVHLGDAFVLIAAALLPAPYAIASAAIGGALADLLTGYVVWLPATFIIAYGPLHILAHEKDSCSAQPLRCSHCNIDQRGWILPFSSHLHITEPDRSSPGDPLQHYSNSRWRSNIRYYRSPA